MSVSKDVIQKVLKKLVSPKWNGILKYDIDFSTHDDTGVTYIMIDVIFDTAVFWKILRNSNKYNYASEIDNDISFDIKNAMKYLGIDKVIVEVYTFDNSDD